MGAWFSTSLDVVLAVVGSTAAVYVSTLVATRIAGRRTLAQMSAFDIVVTVALGTIVANTATAREPSYLASMTALVTLLVLQVLVALGNRRWDRFRRVVMFTPVVLVLRGRPTEHLRMARMTEEELRSKLRQKGVFRVEDAGVAVLEPTGELSVLPRGEDGDALVEDVRRIVEGKTP